LVNVSPWAEANEWALRARDLRRLPPLANRAVF